MRRLETSYSTLVWSADGSHVTKARTAANGGRRRFGNELRVNLMLRSAPPSVPTPRLLDYDRHARSLTFEAIPGEPLGPKYPSVLRTDEIDGIVDLADRLRPYRPGGTRLRRFITTRRLAQARDAGLLDGAQVSALEAVADRHHQRLRFAHGDLTARNVLAAGRKLWLIDWEWAGLYPPGYELAFLWFSLGEVDGARAQVEQFVAVDEPAFLLSALLIELWHVRWYVPAQFRARHLATRDELLARLSV